MKNNQEHLPYSFYYYPVLLFCLVGIFVTGYLAQSHYFNYTDATYSSFCAISRAINCDTVAQSPWSILWGLPVAIWGLFGYLLFFLLLIPLRKEDRTFFPVWNLLFFLALIFSSASLFFAYISSTKIHSYCILCIASYAINFALLFSTWLISRRFQNIPFFQNIIQLRHILFHTKSITWPLFLFALIFAITIGFIPEYWELNSSGIPQNIARGVTENGHPWIGAENPVLVIEEFSDYQCFQCYKMQNTLRLLVGEHSDKIRLVHRHYPMDHEYNPMVVPTPFHIGAGKMAILAIYATEKGQFWEMNDALFELGRSKKSFNIKFLARKTQIPVNDLATALTDARLKRKLNFDILNGMKKRITATPSFVINNTVYVGSIPPGILQKAIGNE